MNAEKITNNEEIKNLNNRTNNSNKKIYLKHDNNYYEYLETEKDLKLEIKQILDHKTSQDTLGKIRKEKNHCRLVDFLFNKLSNIKKEEIQIAEQIPFDQINSIIIEFDNIIIFDTNNNININIIINNDNINKTIYLKHNNKHYKYTATEKTLTSEIENILKNYTNDLDKIKNDNSKLKNFLFNKLSNIQAEQIPFDQIYEYNEQTKTNDIKNNNIIIEFDKINIHFFNIVLDFDYQEVMNCDEKNKKFITKKE